MQNFTQPQADAINRVFAASQSQVGTKLGTVKETPKLERSKEFSVTQRNRLNTKKKMVPGVGVVPFVTGSLEATPKIMGKHFFWAGSGNLEVIVGSWQKRLRKLFELAGVSHGRGHMFRDTFACELLLAGVPLERVSILLGHQSVRVTERYYAAWTDSRQRQVEADLKRAWEQDPIVLLEAKATRQLRGKNEAVN